MKVSTADNNLAVEVFLTLVLSTLWLVVLTFTTITILLNSNFASTEYRRSDFPVDKLGMEFPERIQKAELATYFIQPYSHVDDIELWNAGFRVEEISHLKDVKSITVAITVSGILSSILLVALHRIFLKYRKPVKLFINSLFLTSIFTLISSLMLTIGVMIGWDELFINFHQLLFPPNTWSFPEDWLLIRLFPEKFWIDAAVSFIVITIVESLIGISLTFRNARLLFCSKI